LLRVPFLTETSGSYSSNIYIGRSETRGKNGTETRDEKLKNNKARSSSSRKRARAKEKKARRIKERDVEIEQQQR